MHYPRVALPEASIPSAVDPLFQHLVDTYAGETNKVDAVWSGFDDSVLGYRPHAKSGTVGEIMKHQLLSERRFFAEFLSSDEPAAASVLPGLVSVDAFRLRMVELALPRLGFLASRDQAYWMGLVRFFDVERARIWVFWRRVLHTAHHRTQLSLYLRMLERVVPATYGPTADISWAGADPTLSVKL